MKPTVSSRLVYWVVSLNAVRSQSTCHQALSLTVGNVTLANGQIARGAAVGVGTPSQPMAFLPQIPINNSFVYGNSGYCNSITPGWEVDGCTTFRGGAYDSAGSSTMHDEDTSAFASDTSDNINIPDLKRISDTVTLDSNSTLESFPIGIVQDDWGGQGYYPQAALGLGPDSTLLSTLVDSGTIASRTWSWFWGLSGAPSSDSTQPQLDGSLVLGGYDKAKVDGEGYKQSIMTGSGRCDTGLFVTLTDVILNWVDGTSSSLFADGDTSSLLAACIDPSYPALATIPLNPYWSNFQTTTDARTTGHSTGLQWYNMLYEEAETPFTGDITLQFASGLSVRVDNTQYIGPDVNIDKTTGALTTNNSAPDVVAFIALTSDNANDVIRIGRNFFSAAYLMVNYDAGEFTVWPTAQDITPSQNLVAVDTSGAELDDLCSSDKTPTVTAGSSNTTGSSTTASTASSDATSSGGTPSLNVPAIAGSVVGGVVGIASISALIIWFTLRRRKAKKDAGVTELHHDNIPAGSHASIPRAAETLHELAPESKSYHELPSRGSGFKEGELRGERGLGYETPRFELSDNPARHQI